MDKSVFEQGAEKPSKKNRLRLGIGGERGFTSSLKCHFWNPKGSRDCEKCGKTIAEPKELIRIVR